MSTPGTTETIEQMQERINALNPDTMDWNDAAAYAALGIGAGDDDGPIDESQIEQGDTDVQQAAAAPASAPAAAPAAAPAPSESSAPPAAASASESGEQVEGVATADGRRVIPYAVLRQTREEARHFRDENERLRQQLEEATKSAAGTGQQDLVARANAAPETLTDEDLAELEQDYPTLSKALKAIKATQAQVQQLAQAPAPAAPAPAAAPAAQAAQQAEGEEEFDAAIAASPLISKWMTDKGPEWDRARAIDRVLLEDPKTANLTFAQRFAKVERMVAAEFEIPLPSKTQPNPAAPPAAAAPAAPAAAPAAPVRASALPTLTDLGGTPPASGEDAINSKTAADLLAATNNMSEEQLMRMAGVIY